VDVRSRTGAVVRDEPATHAASNGRRPRDCPEPGTRHVPDEGERKQDSPLGTGKLRNPRAEQVFDPLRDRDLLADPRHFPADDEGSGHVAV
jgi:hypothetical protein